MSLIVPSGSWVNVDPTSSHAEGVYTTPGRTIDEPDAEGDNAPEGNVMKTRRWA